MPLVSKFVKQTTTDDRETERTLFKLGNILICKQVAPLTGNEVAPPLEMDKEYPLKRIYLDSKGNPHFDVDLESRFNYVRSYITEEILPESGPGQTHWCDPVRFILKHK